MSDFVSDLSEFMSDFPELFLNCVRLVRLCNDNLNKHLQGGDDMEEKFISTAEAAKILQISSRTLRRWDDDGTLKAHHKSNKGYRYYTEQQIYDFLEEYYGKYDKAKETENKIIEIDVDSAEIKEITTEIVESEKGEIIDADSVEIIQQEQSVKKQPRQSKAIVAQNHYFSTSKLVRKLKEICLNEMVQVNLGKAGYVRVKMWLDKEMQQKLMNEMQVKIMPTAFNTPEYELHLTEEDIFIIESVKSLKNAGNKEFTAAQLVKHMHGNSTGGISDTDIKAIEERLRLMMTWFIRIEVTEEFSHYKNLPSEIRDIQAIQGHLLDTVIIERKDKDGKTRVSFGFPINGCFGIPDDKDVAVILESYSESTKQMACFPTKLLDIPRVRISRATRILVNYIIKKIQGLKGNKKGINTMLFSTIEEDLYMQNYSAKKKSLMRKFILTIIESCREEGLIYGYELIKERRQYKSVKIEWEEEKKKKNVKKGNGTGRGNKVHTRKSGSIPDANR